MNNDSVVPTTNFRVWNFQRVCLSLVITQPWRDMLSGLTWTVNVTPFPPMRSRLTYFVSALLIGCSNPIRVSQLPHSTSIIVRRSLFRLPSLFRTWKGNWLTSEHRVNLQTPSTESATYRNISYARWTREDSKVKQILTTKSIKYEFIRASHIWKTSIIAALIIDVL